MNMTEKNGQPSMEEILASIRRIIAEEPTGHSHNGELRGTPIMLNGDSALEDSSEFDLPAIFRSSPPAAAERPAPLLGRLTDAIRSATTTQPEARGPQTSDDYPQAEPADAVAVENGYPALSSLKPARPEAPAEPARAVNGTSLGSDPHPSPAGPGAFPTMAASGGKTGDEPRRVMAPFKDTHFMRMASPPSSAAPSPTPAAAPAPMPAPAAAPPPEPASPVDFSSIVPGQFDRGAFVNAASPAAPQPHVAPAAMPPPPLPAGDPGQHALVVVPPSGSEETGTIEDTTADLLRPMLRQWLADNMPRMVEKALHIEIAESIKAPKKP